MGDGLSVPFIVSCWKRICLFVEKQDFAVANRRNLVQTKKRKREINTKCVSRANGPSKISEYNTVACSSQKKELP